jgi:hypothetical protein
MHVPGLLFDMATRLALQVDPNQGTATAQKGAVQRLADPTYYDLIFPVIAFVLVIALPTAVAAWVIWRTATEKTKEADER